MRRMVASILAPGVSKAMRIQLAMATEVAQTSGGGVGGGGSVSGGCGCGLQRDGDADIGGGTHHGRKGTPIANNVCIPVLTLRVGENIRDVLRNMSLPTLGVSVWCKRWHQGGKLLHIVRAKGEPHTPNGSRTSHSYGRLGGRTRVQLMVAQCHCHLLYSLLPPDRAYLFH